MPTPVPETTKVIPLTSKNHITLAPITHHQLVRAINASSNEGKYENLKPQPVEGYTHEMAYENIATYKAQWDQWQSKVWESRGFVWAGAAWQTAGLDMDEGVWEAEVAAALQMAKKLNLPPANTKDILELGALAYALIDNRLGEQVITDIILWLQKGAGLLDASEVEAERKSAEGNGQQPTPVGSQQRDEKPGKKRR